MTDLKSQYETRYANMLIPLAQRLNGMLQDYFHDVRRIDRISVRAKEVGRFLAKAQRLMDGKPKYSDPLNQIQDQIGARIVTFYIDDVEAVGTLAEKYFRYIEMKTIVPDSESEFGYFGKHFIMLVPPDLLDDTVQKENAPNFFELQIKTLFQHAWSEANHDLGYKPEGTLSSEEKRRIAFTAAQAWGADMIFNELHQGRSDRALS